MQGYCVKTRLKYLEYFTSQTNRVMKERVSLHLFKTEGRANKTQVKADMTQTSNRMHSCGKKSSSKDKMKATQKLDEPV